MPVVRVMLGDGHRFTRVSIQDVPFARSVRWHYTKGYAGHGPKGIYLARELMGLKKGDGLQVDHINRRPLDNFRSNLRVVTPRQNCWNRAPDPYRGVGWHPRAGKWRARVKINGKEIHLGLFTDRDEAAAAATAARERLAPAIT